MAPCASLLLLLLGADPGLAVATAPRAFDPAAEQAKQAAAVASLQSASEQTAVAEQKHRRDADAKPGEAQAAAQAAAARAQTPEGRMEAQAEADRDAAQPRVVARAEALRRELAVQPDATGHRQGERVRAAELQARDEARRMSATAAPPPR